MIALLLFLVAGRVTKKDKTRKRDARRIGRAKRCLTI
jgi:hypothetical protein